MLLRPLLGLFLLLGLSGCTGFFFQPMKEHVADPQRFGFAYEDVDFTSRDGARLHGWLFPAAGRRVGSILFLHGNAENISTHFANVVWLTEAGFDAFVIDYRGYGRSEGVPDLDGLHLDAAAALDWLLAMPSVKADEVIVFGQSLGGAIALETVANSSRKNDLAGLVVEGAFSGYRAIAREKLASFWLTSLLRWPIGLTINNRYDPKKAAAALSPTPVLIVHGQTDDVVPPHHGEILFEAAAEPKTIWQPKEAGHIAAFSTLSMRKRLVDYLNGLIDPPKAVSRTIE